VFLGQKLPAEGALVVVIPPNMPFFMVEAPVHQEFEVGYSVLPSVEDIFVLSCL
jgi:hypothetical protein